MSHAPPSSRRFPALVLSLGLLGSLALGACAPRAATLSVGPEGPEAPVSPLLDPASPEMNAEAPPLFKVLFETSAGDFVVEVERGLAPLGADRFYNLVRNGYYDGVRFFRVVPGFVVQFGLSGDPAVAEAWRGARIEDDPVAGSNTRGTLTYAMAGPGTRTVQVFINLGNNARLDDQGFAPFGTVSGGMDVVDRLHGGYGDGAPRGQGPDQGRIGREGEPYLAGEFPLLDQVIRARVLEVPIPPKMMPPADTPPEDTPPQPARP
jgi:peptidyl-prolyl cis-trans isomerase A (cyclophilin A)